jgi:hypothetical protein
MNFKHVIMQFQLGVSKKTEKLIKPRKPEKTEPNRFKPVFVPK